MTRHKGNVSPYRNGRFKARIGADYLGIFDSEAEAWRAIKAELAIKDAQRGEAPDGAITLRIYAAQWFEEREASGVVRRVSKERSVWRQHVDTAVFADWPMAKVRPGDVSKWLLGLLKKHAMMAVRDAAEGVKKTATDRRLNPKTASNARSLLKQCFASALLDPATKVKENPVTGVRMPKVARVIEDEDVATFLSTREIEQVFATVNSARERCFFAILIYTGLRDGELLGLRWSDVTLPGVSANDGKRPEVRVRRSYTGPVKTQQSRRSVPILPQLEPFLRAWLAECRRSTVVAMDGLVFAPDWSDPNRRRARYWARANSRTVPRQTTYAEGYDCNWADRSQRINGDLVRVAGWRTKAGVRPQVTLHDLRHTCASHLIMGTWGVKLDIYELKDWLGHADVGVTQRYAHLDPDHLHGKVEKLRKRPLQPAVQEPPRSCE